jgi:hypothetical protein
MARVAIRHGFGYFAYSGEFGRLFRLKSATWSGPNRPPVPIDFGHRSRRRRIDGC